MGRKGPIRSSFLTDEAAEDKKPPVLRVAPDLNRLV
jgi:hypothetical protein